MLETNVEELEAAARLLADSGLYKVIKRMDPLPVIEAPEGARVAAIVDVETTGRDKTTDKIVELGMVLFAFDPASGGVLGVTSRYNGLEDPGMPIPPEVTKVNNITDDMVAGQKLDDETIEQMARQADLVIAHNAAFDRWVVERRLPFFESKPWGCSMAQIDWENEGIGSRKLDYIAAELGFFYDAHRAENDCLALLEVLRRKLPVSNETGARRLFVNAMKPEYVLWALGNTYDVKEILKKRGYGWCDDATGKGWRIGLPGPEALESEIEWLRTEIWKKRPFEVQVDTVDAYTRFSPRRSDRKRRQF